MPTPKIVRDSAFELARLDLALFLEEHEDDLLTIFREEVQRLDDELPEEEVYIDIDMVGMGDLLLKAVLRAMQRFLRETSAPRPTSRRRRRRLSIDQAEKTVIKIPINSRR